MKSLRSAPAFMSEDMGFRKSFLTKLCATPVEGKFEGEKCFAQLRAEKMNPILAETEVAIFGLSADCPALGYTNVRGEMGTKYVGGGKGRYPAGVVSMARAGGVLE